MSIDTVVFDLGGVLIDWNPRYLYRKLSDDSDRIEFFLSSICHGGWNEKQDEGRPFADGIAELLRVHPQHEEWIRAYFERWPEMLKGEISGTVEILEEIRRHGRHRIFALSNWSAETFPIARSRYGFFSLFDEILLSGKEKLIKPDPRFFQLLIERHSVVPEKSVFIDDVEKNIVAARQLGFQTVHFTDPNSLRRKFAEFGIFGDET